jgi:hypothetical protein
MLASNRVECRPERFQMQAATPRSKADLSTSKKNENGFLKLLNAFKCF